MISKPLSNKDLIVGHTYYSNDDNTLYTFIGKCKEVSVNSNMNKVLFYNGSDSNVYLDKYDFIAINEGQVTRRLMNHLSRKSTRRFHSDLGLDDRVDVSFMERYVEIKGNTIRVHIERYTDE